MTVLIRIALFFVATPVIGQKLELDLVAAPVLQSRLESGVVGRGQRQGTIRKLFADAGCTAEEQRVERNVANVICTLPGELSSTIIVGGHFDFAEKGDGIIDDWSGASLLPSLYQALKKEPHRHTFVFVAFAAEEKGLVGSSRYVSKLNVEQKAGVGAFVNLECLGLATPVVWLKRASPALAIRLNEVAHAIGIQLKGVDVDAVGDDDSHSFVAAKIPSITIHSMSQETLGILHSSRDRLDAVRSDDYYSAYKLAAFFLWYLDSKTE